MGNGVHSLGISDGHATMSSIVLLHLSDLHFGPDGDPVAQTRKPGQEVHDPDLIRFLSKRIRRLRAKCLAEDTLFHVVCTGDLTGTGTAQELRRALRFLRTDHSIGEEGDEQAAEALAHGEYSGLGLDPSEFTLVPGNHDHWGGPASWPNLPVHNPGLLDLLDSNKLTDLMRGVNWDGKLADFFVEQKPLVVGGLTLRICGMDSSSGWRGALTGVSARPIQSGRLSMQQVERLEKWGEAQGQHAGQVVNVVLHHHDLEPWPENDDLLQRLYAARKPLTRRPWPLEPISRHRLIERCQKQKVSLVLSGHQHDEPALEERESSSQPNLAGARVSKVWEAVAPTGGVFVDELHPAPGFLLHHFELEGSQVLWNCAQYTYRRSARGFDTVPQMLTPVRFGGDF